MVQDQKPKLFLLVAPDECGRQRLLLIIVQKKRSLSISLHIVSDLLITSLPSRSTYALTQYSLSLISKKRLTTRKKSFFRNERGICLTPRLHLQFEITSLFATQFPPRFIPQPLPFPNSLGGYFLSHLSSIEYHAITCETNYASRIGILKYCNMIRSSSIIVIALPLKKFNANLSGELSSCGFSHPPLVF